MKKLAIVVLVTAASASGLLLWKKTTTLPDTKIKASESPSSKAVAQKPGKMSAAEQREKKLAETAKALENSPAELAKFVDRYVFTHGRHGGWDERAILAQLGDKAYPRALEILKDPALREKLLTEKSLEFMPSLETPLARLCRIFDLKAAPPQEAPALLAPHLASKHHKIRQTAAFVIASSGQVKFFPELERALKDEDAQVRSDALWGIQKAISGGRIDPAHSGRYYELVAPMLQTDPDFQAADRVPSLVLQLDKKRGTARLLENDVFTARFEPVWRILQAFNTEKVEVPRDRLLALLEEASKLPLDFPMDVVLEETLALLGKLRNPDDLPVLERYLEHSDEQVCMGAVTGLFSYHRHYETLRTPSDAEESLGWDALTPVEKHILAVRQLDGQVKNGGFSQYYFNPSGDKWKLALEGLKAMGATERVLLMEETLAKFPKSSPSSDRDLRQRQLDMIERKQEYSFSKQDKAWYKSKEPLVRFVYRYDRANPKGREK